MKFMSPEYRITEIAVLIKILDDARTDIEEAKTEDRIGLTTDETREIAIEALDDLSGTLHDRLFKLARDFIPLDH